MAGRAHGSRRAEHKGITIFLVDLSLPGVKVSPIETMVVRTTATFYDDVRVPVTARVAEEGQGWRLLTTPTARAHRSARPRAWRLDEGLPASEDVAVAKFWAADGGHRVVSAAQHGGVGVDLSYPLHRYFFWSKQIEVTLGSATRQLVRLGRPWRRPRASPDRQACGRGSAPEQESDVVVEQRVGALRVGSGSPAA